MSIDILFVRRRYAQAMRHGLLLILLLCMLGVQTYGQQKSIQTPALDPRSQADIVDSVSAALTAEYVFPEVAAKMNALLRKNLKLGAYEKLTNPDDFAAKITEDLQSISHDKHLNVRYIPPGTQRDEVKLSPEERRRVQLAQQQARNFGFQKVEVLPGNIGYIDFRYFAEAKDGGPTAIAAMNFLAYTDALIFDLRRNGGGNPSMIQLISSYLFEESVHLNSFYLRKGDSTQQFWTQECVEGPKMTGIPVYVLTSSSTFSGAEEFSYNLKNLKRGTIVGETTGGGAHPVNLREFPVLNISMAVPYGRAINPITGTNWEGVGVQPDITASASKALTVARAEALKELIRRTSDESRKGRLSWTLDELTVEMNPASPADSMLSSCAGTFGPRSIRFENGTLYYRRVGRPEFRLIPMGADRFMVESLDYFRLQFRRDSSGKVNELVGQYDNGESDTNPRTQ
ncbi:MAG: peptidase [Bacteroidetes bacterium]|nr:peptidase [Bacteroidota bacterium]